MFWDFVHIELADCFSVWRVLHACTAVYTVSFKVQIIECAYKQSTHLHGPLISDSDGMSRSDP